jgi:hypothetical protein
LCTATQTIIVTEPPALTSTQTHSNVDCNGDNSGSASVTASGGTGAYSYSWSPNVSSSASANNIPADTYTITIRDANGCETTQTINVTEPPALTSTQTHTNVACGGANNGTASVTASGGTGAYSYSWNPGGQTIASRTGLSSGTYIVTITDANGCTSVETIVITQGTGLTTAQTHTNTCYGRATGTASVNVTGGTPPYSYAWSPLVSVGSSASGLPAATYTITITDAFGCTATETIVITQFTQMSFSATYYPEICDSYNGWITINVFNGQPPYTYFWTPPETPTATIINLDNSLYIVSVTDANGCQDTFSVDLPAYHDEPDQPGTITGPATVCNGQSYVYSIAAAGGWPDDYVWTVPAGANITAGQGTTSITVLFGGTSGNVSVYASNFCGSSATTTRAVNVTCRIAGDAASENFSVFPNPANDKINVSISGMDNAQIRVELFDLLGKSVYLNSGKSELDYLSTIDIGHLSSGIYLLKVQYMDVVKMVKVVKE